MAGTVNLKKGATFSLGHAKNLFDTHNFGDQLEALNYAMEYAAPTMAGVNPARVFILDVCRMGEDEVSSDIRDYAWSLLMDLYGAYVRSVIDQQLNRLNNLTADERADRTEEAMQECWAYIHSRLPEYDASKGKFTTFIKSKYLAGQISANEAKNLPGVGSRRNLSIDGKVERIRRELIRQNGAEPSPMDIVVADPEKNNRNRLKIDQVTQSLARLAGNNGIRSLYETSDEGDEQNIADIIPQTRFETPEQKVMAAERTESILNAMAHLTPIERDALLYFENIGFEDGMFVDTNDVVNEAQFAGAHGIKIVEARQYLNSAKAKMKNELALVLPGYGRASRQDNVNLDPMLFFNEIETDAWTNGFEDIGSTFAESNENISESDFVQ